MVGGWFPRRRGRNPNWKKFNIKFFSFDTLRIATANFSTLLGRGGYGSLFKGILSDDDGRSVAILRLHKPYRNGFLEMVEFMSHLRHRNLIQIIGCCVENDEQLLVCEFAENGSVWHHLQSRERSTFDWEIRAGVCVGTARGLSYLHEEIDPRVIHRDIKPSNILLDSNFVPKIVDFDLVDLVDDCLYIGVGEGTAKGKSPGFEYPFSDPDKMFSGQLTEKVDVYGFGVCMLEIITGRNSIDMEPKEAQEDVWILHWVKRMRNGGAVLKIVDPLLTHFPEKDVVRFIDVALMCTHPISEQRPSMFEVVHMLYGRYRSDQEISQMASKAAAAAEPSEWSNPYARAHTPVISVYSPTGTSEKADVTQSNNNNASMGIDCEELGETTGCFCSAIVPIRKEVSKSTKGKCSSTKEAALQLAETSLASSSKHGAEDVRTCYERSMEKIMRHQLTIHDASKKTTMRTNQTIQESKHFREVVYPPLPSGEYRPPRLLNSGWQ